MTRPTWAVPATAPRGAPMVPPGCEPGATVTHATLVWLDARCPGLSLGWGALLLAYGWRGAWGVA